MKSCWKKFVENRKHWLKFSLFIWAALPFIYLAFLISTDQLGTNPQEFIERYLGTCTLVLILVTYSISARFNKVIAHLISCRRMLGLFSFVYMTCHFFAYIVFEHSFWYILWSSGGAPSWYLSLSSDIHSDTLLSSCGAPPGVFYSIWWLFGCWGFPSF